MLRRIRYEDERHLSPAEKRQGFVLSCRTRVMDDLSVSVDESFLKECQAPKILGFAKSFAVKRDPFIKKQFIETEKITRVYGGFDILGVEPGNTADKNYGLVVDIGTTTLVASLMDNREGREMASVSSLNPQCLHAQDVLSRIRISSDEQGLSLMYQELTHEINRMIAGATRSAGIRQENIYEVVYSGNTCMLHLATGVSPHSLGKYPYTPQIFGGTHVRAAEHGLAIAAFGVLYLPPVISGYVGADITSGILASRLHDQKDVVLFVDIGTNGEMVIASEGRLSATSAAAGPAFEGMNIACGTRADQGAVEHVDMDENGTMAVETIGRSEAVGLCGSGLVDLVGELVTHGVIRQNGKLADPQTNTLPPALRERLVRHRGKLRFQVSDRIFLSQQDIRQVQLAKGAVRTGVEVLLQQRGIKASDVDRILIAGAFGYHARAANLINIGLLPREFAGRMAFVGNTSQSGGQAFLLNKAYRREMKEIVKSIDVLELAKFPDFEKIFVKSLNF